MNIKVMVLIVIILLVAVIAIQIFLPKKINLAEGTVTTFKAKEEPTTSTAPATTTATV